jgi:hypothetical protein
MTLTIIAGAVFLAHVAVWVGLPAGRIENERASSEMALDTI